MDVIPGRSRRLRGSWCWRCDGVSVADPHLIREAYREETAWEELFQGDLRIYRGGRLVDGEGAADRRGEILASLEGVLQEVLVGQQHAVLIFTQTDGDAIQEVHVLRWVEGRPWEIRIYRSVAPAPTGGRGT